MVRYKFWVAVVLAFILVAWSMIGAVPSAPSVEAANPSITAPAVVPAAFTVKQNANADGMGEDVTIDYTIENREKTPATGVKAYLGDGSVRFLLAGVPQTLKPGERFSSSLKAYCKHGATVTLTLFVLADNAGATDEHRAMVTFTVRPGAPPDDWTG
jgi:hypothetical protein